jgi:glycosyltransferase involved in cell wall biosynthesis
MPTAKSKRLKVLHILVDPLPGGMEVLMLNVLKEQHQGDVCDNVVASICYANSPHSMRADIEEVASFYDLDCASFFSRRFCARFRRLLREEKPDVVHAWSYDSGLVAGFIARFLHGIKVVWGIHSLDLPSRHQYSRHRFAILKSLVGLGSRIIPHRVISCAKSATDSHVKFGYPRKRCVNIANGIDVNRFKPDGAISLRLRKDLGMDATTPIVGYVGRSHPVKRLEDYFSAVAMLMRSRPDVHFVAMGFSEEALYPEAQKAFAQLPEPSRMHILGSCHDPENYIPAFTVNVLSSQSEALPMVLMEAMSCGVPCVTTDVGSAGEVIGPVGKCVAPGNPELLAGAVSALLDEVLSNQSEWSEKARHHCLKHYDIATTERKHTQVYRDVTGIKTGNEPESTRVIHLINSVGFGGAEVLLKRLTIGLKADGVDQTVISVLPGGDLVPAFEKAGIPVKTLNAKGIFSGVRGLFRLAAIIRKEKPDLVQTWMYHSALIGTIAAWLSFRSPKTLWSIHHTKLGKKSSKRTTRVIHRVLAFLSSYTPDRIIYCSQAALDLHLGDGFDDSRAKLIFNGTDISTYRADDAAKQKIRGEYGIPMDAPLIGMAGRYHPQKDHANLLRAFAIVQKEIPDAHLIVCGQDITRETPALPDLADACPSPSQVHLIGPRFDMPHVYPAFSIAALSSCEGEAFPLVLGEAMACEVPCVATDVGDSALIIGDTGRIVAPRDSAALASAMVGMLQDTRKDQGKMARQRVADHFTLRLYVQSHADLYSDLMNPARAPDKPDRCQSVRNKPQPVSH